MPCLSPWACSSLPEQRGVGEESFNALRFAGAAGQFSGVPIVQLSVISVVVVLRPAARVNLCC